MRIVNGKSLTLPVNLLDIYHGKTKQNYLIQDGDFIFIPGRSNNGNPTDQFLNPLFTFSNLLNSRLFN